MISGTVPSDLNLDTYTWCFSFSLNEENDGKCEDVEMTRELGHVCGSRHACSLLTDPVSIAILSGSFFYFDFWHKYLLSGSVLRRVLL